jgi:hypothetical protein
MVVVAIIAAIAGAAMSVYDWINVQRNLSGNETEGVRATVGNGLYLCAAGFVLSALALLSSSRATPSD